MRWLPEIGPRWALAATTAIAMLCMVGDLTMITILMLSGMRTRALAAIAVAASLTRIACSITTVRHTRDGKSVTRMFDSGSLAGWHRRRTPARTL